MRHLLLATIATLTSYVSATAQSYNVDVGDNLPPHGVPSSSYGGAAGVAGVWNGVSAILAASPIPLVDVTGASAGVTIQRTSGAAAHFTFDNALTLGDDDALLDDVQDVGFAPSSTTWVVAGLPQGAYFLYTYAWAPDSASYVTTVNGATAVGGAYVGSLALGVTHALDLVSVGPSGTITIQVDATTIYGSLNGFQIVRAQASATPFCFGDGSGTACPCANAGVAGRGCASSLNPNGAQLVASGTPSVSNDTFLLTGTGMPASPGLYFQGTVGVAGGAGNAFGDGLRCAGGTVIRLGIVQAPAGSSTYPSGAVPPNNTPISVQGLVSPGYAREYQLWYRDSGAFCTPSVFNLTNAIHVTWAP